MTSLQLTRKNEVMQQLSVSRDTLRRFINDGLIPPTISIGSRAVAFVQSEVDTVIHARMNGANDDQVKHLVADLVFKRSD